ncbi:MAG: glycosyltransferase family 2 protein [Oscillospiraceae bacterium]|nr:glycosyltransferase family 2 protein [Oscillospiraceae bacterium]
MSIIKDTELYKKAEPIIKYAVNFLAVTKNARAVKKAIKENSEYLKAFKKAFRQRSRVMSVRITNDSLRGFVESYRKKNVKAIKIADVKLSDNEPIMLCPVKDDLTRIKEHVRHYRQIGVRHLAYIDNESTDGTFEWLSEQGDVSLFTVSETFNPARKLAWMRQAADILGFDRWYLKPDSDEFFVYPSIETISISRYIEHLETKNIDAVLAPMIDMYSKDSVFSSDLEHDFRQKHCYFDTDTYTRRTVFYTQSITGGPRYRAFALCGELAKYPLVKAKESYFLSDHDACPYKLNFQTKGAGAFLLHYKFLDYDYDKYLKFAKSGIHTKDSGDHKRYISTHKENPQMSLYCSSSQKLTSSMDLLKINICDDAFFNELAAVFQ